MTATTEPAPAERDHPIARANLGIGEAERDHAPGGEGLAACPFCGSDATEARLALDGGWKVGCTACDRWLTKQHDRVQALRAWNSRTPAPVLPVEEIGRLQITPRIGELLGEAALLLDHCAGHELEVEGISALRVVEALHNEMFGVDADMPFHEAVEAALLTAAQARAAPADGEVERLRAHIEEQATHAETRIKDGIEMGATVWRIALEDIARENRAALNPPEQTPALSGAEEAGDGR